LWPARRANARARRRSRGRILLKIICLGDAWTHASRVEQTEHYGGGQCEHLSSEEMIHFHRHDYSFQLSWLQADIRNNPVTLLSEIAAALADSPPVPPDVNGI